MCRSGPGTGWLHLQLAYTGFELEALAAGQQQYHAAPWGRHHHHHPSTACPAGPFAASQAQQGHTAPCPASIGTEAPEAPCAVACSTQHAGAPLQPPPFRSPLVMLACGTAAYAGACGGVLLPYATQRAMLDDLDGRGALGPVAVGGLLWQLVC